MVNLKSILPVDRIQRKVAEWWPSAVFVGATHDEPDKVRHCHAVIRFELPTRWGVLRDWLKTNGDEHNYCKPARSWRRSVRYLLHMDNPEKARISRSALVWHGIDDDELDQLLGSAKMRILDSLVSAQRLPLDQRFRFLVEERGHLPSEVSAALRCLLDLEMWARSRRSELSALPSDVQPTTDDDSTLSFDDDGAGVVDDESGSSFDDPEKGGFYD